MNKLCRMLAVILVILIVTIPLTAYGQSEGHIKALMNTVNSQLAAGGGSVRLWVTETYTGSQYAGQTVYFNNRTLRLDADWVPGDPGRSGNTDISWLSDLTEGTAKGVLLDDTQTAIYRAMTTWNNVGCSYIPLVKLGDTDIDLGYVQYLVGMGGVPGWLADYTLAGWLPAAFFETALGPGTSEYVLGVTFTFIWVDESGNPTDIDNNKKLDVAFRETYFNNDFPWGINTTFPIDVESVVLHEAGHGLSLGHFGKLIRTDANGKLHFAPKAVMNAGYVTVQQSLSISDMGAFCSIWASWPNR